jgi:C1A family cysteine protease
MASHQYRVQLAASTPVVPDAPDRRDIRWTTRGLKLPLHVDNSADLVRIENQRQTSSCVANALTSKLEAIKKRISKQKEQLSRLHLYYHARLLSGWQDKDEGSTIRNALKASYRVGICSEKTWPFWSSRVNKAPSAQADAEGASNKVTRYERLITQRHLMEALATGHMVIYALGLESSFMDLTGRLTDNYLGLDKPRAVYEGNHAMVLVGYTTINGVVYLIGANSWSRSWGHNGFYLIRADVALRDGFDFWVVREFDGCAVEHA